MATIKGAGYSRPAKILHWLVALSVIVIVPVGLLMGRAKGPLADGLYNFHKSLGALVLILMTLRIIYRFSRGAPATEPTLKSWERIASETVHWSLYVLLIVTPLVGLFAMSAYGASTPFFGLFEIPPIIAQNKPLAGRLFYLHGWLGWAVGVLFCMHIAAALQHHFIRRDGVMRRMLPKAMGGA